MDILPTPRILLFTAHGPNQLPGSGCTMRVSTAVVRCYFSGGNDLGDGLSRSQQHKARTGSCLVRQTNVSALHAAKPEGLE